MGIDDSLTQEIVQRLLGVTKADRIILFGSAAAGAMTRGSDIDLLVVSPAPANPHISHSTTRCGAGTRACRVETHLDTLSRS